MKISLKLFAVALAAGIVLTLAPAHADEPVTQGAAAYELAMKLGLAAQTTKPLTELEAIRLLMELGISPFGGWDADSVLMEHDLARILVLAMGMGGDIPEEDRDNPETDAYRDLLVREFNLDISSLTAALAGAPAADPSLRTQAGATGGSDPLVSTVVLAQALNALTPAPGAGRPGRPSPAVDDTTPSEPS